MDFITLGDAKAQAALAETVSKDLFNREFSVMIQRLETQEKKLDKQENQVSQVIIGVLIAAFLVYVATAFQVALYAASK